MSRGPALFYAEGYGARIRTARKAAGLTHHVLAKRLFCSYSLVSQWETETTKPGQSLLARLARELGVTREWLRVASTEPDSGEDLPPFPEEPVIDEAAWEAALSGGSAARTASGPVCNPAFGWAGWRP